MPKKRNSGFAGFEASQTIVNNYARQLRSLSREIARIRSCLTNRTMSDVELLLKADEVNTALHKYAEFIEPWASDVAMKAIGAVNTKNIKTWRSLSSGIRRQLANGFGDAVMDVTIQNRIRLNAALIKNIPQEAGDRIARMVRVGLVEGKRSEILAKELMTTEGFAESRANLIARTEISKATTEITRVRAVDFGSPGYVWRTSRDGAVRESHAGMEGETVEWDKPPTLDGMTGHAGEFPYCRCYPEVIIPSAMMEAA